MKLSYMALVAILASTVVPAFAQELPKHKYSANVPSYILTPDTVQTRIGTLKFFDGLPDKETVEKVYDQLDFGRGLKLSCRVCRPHQFTGYARA
ncbi:hypothetical protein AAFX91_34270 [Bradyrhizobium sp. 31Argb]|uniref:hypothetical protein n=1 Tax=Bradyrhizobium sp. 31Argb TaxID=3141247 RepID=UPI0037486B79